MEKFLLKNCQLPLESLPYGSAITKVIVNSAGAPVDWVLMVVSLDFETLAGLERENILGKKMTEALAGTEKPDSDRVSIYARVTTSAR